MSQFAKAVVQGIITPLWKPKDDHCTRCGIKVQHDIRYCTPCKRTLENKLATIRSYFHDKNK